MERKQQGKENREWGAEAEQIAADWLRVRGYIVRETNYRRKNVEIDIIAELPGEIVFFEVKARRGDKVEPLDAINEKKIKMMVRGADAYLREFDKLFKYRFDIITITGTPDNFKLDHFPDAFLPPFSRR
ncbi:MAG: YraN family protein [Muribaculaceae bacterium]|nr:YraN family protein [Muribaculaceae bacterium]